MADTAASFRVAADAYDRYVGRYGPDLSAGLIAAAGVRPGMRVLDVGCGPGALATALARVVAEEAVAAVDPSETFVAACRARLPAADIRLAAAEELPFADDTFDAALAQLVVNFMRDPGAGVREMARVTRPGGRVAACVWDYLEGMTLMRAFWDAATAIHPTAPDEGRAMPYAREGELARLLERAGLRDVRRGELTAHASYASFADLAEPLGHGVGPAGAHYVSLAEGERARLRADLQRRLGVGNGPFRLSARAWLAVGTV
ncbi:MAG: methyltransferase domain-containing protein [Thermoleophilia bacterium]|nr:methyltransferase domain-containing protein [Thermoleophilia bacterium]